MTDKHKNIILGSSKTERVLDADHYEPETHVHIPHEEAVEDAKHWVEDNEL